MANSFFWVLGGQRGVEELFISTQMLKKAKNRSDIKQFFWDLIFFTFFLRILGILDPS